MDIVKGLVTEITLINEDTQETFKIKRDIESAYIEFNLGNSIFDFPVDELDEIVNTLMKMGGRDVETN